MLLVWPMLKARKSKLECVDALFVSMKKKQRAERKEKSHNDELHLDSDDVTTGVDETDFDKEDGTILSYDSDTSEQKKSMLKLKSSSKKKSNDFKLAGKNKFVKWTRDFIENKHTNKSQVVYSFNKKKDGEETNELIHQGIATKSENLVKATEEKLESDDDNGDVNRIGNVPLWWYDDLQHIGYDANGQRIQKSLDMSTITSLLNESENVEAWRTIPDIRNQRTIYLTNNDLKIIRNIQSGRYPLASYDPYGPDSIVDFDNPEAAIHPEKTSYTPKRRFLPSEHENKRINYLVKLIREGRLRLQKKNENDVYDLWGQSIFADTADTARGSRKGPPPLPAPKMKLPGHNESYNVPEEYLLTEEEKQQWLSLHPEDREFNFLPQKYSCLRRVPAYTNLLLERFHRCLDLYLCPRTIKTRMNIDPDSLLPQLPSLDTLKPFPTRLSLTFESSNESYGTCISFDSTGTYMGVSRNSGSLEIFEVASTRLIYQWTPDVTHSNKEFSQNQAMCTLAFSPVHPLVLFSCQSELYVLLLPLPGVKHSKELQETHNALFQCWDLNCCKEVLNLQATDKMESWEPIHYQNISGWKISCQANITSVVWHIRGLYFSTVCNKASCASQQLQIHSLLKRKSMSPLRKSPGGRIKKVAFHPSKPWLFVAFQRSVRLYNLQKNTGVAPQKKIGGVLKKFTGVTDIEDLALHPSGDHFITGGENQRVSWFDYDLGERPYKILRYHKATVKTVGFHSTYPLFFSGSSDGSVHIIHSKVYEDLMNPPAIIPLKKLNPSKEFQFDIHNVSPITSCQWHPIQPWIATALRNGKIGIFV